MPKIRMGYHKLGSFFLLRKNQSKPSTSLISQNKNCAFSRRCCTQLASLCLAIINQIFALKSHKIIELVDQKKIACLNMSLFSLCLELSYIHIKRIKKYRFRVKSYLEARDELRSALPVHPSHNTQN